MKSYRVSYLCYLPDHIVDKIVKRAAEDSFFHPIQVSREEELVGILTGIHLGGKRGCMMIQTSGLGNCINALASLAVPYEIPFLLLISSRGELNDYNPCQVQMGMAQRDLLKSLSIWHVTATREDEFEMLLKGTLTTTYSVNKPVAFILSPLLTGGKSL